MITLAGRTIAALRSEHDALAATVPTLSEAQLTGSSGASDWTVADVLSHLGSGAEITLAGLRAGLGETPAPGPGFNESVWDRWNALSPQDQAAGWLASNSALVTAFESVPEANHEDLKIDIGFLPEPLPFASFAAMRLSEAVPHGWDVRAGLDPAAALTEPSAELLAEHLSSGLSFLLGFIGQPSVAADDAVVEISGTPYRIVLDDKARLTTDAATATATFAGPLESAMRLIYGRLGPKFTPAGVEVTGALTLDELRESFPGF